VRCVRFFDARALIRRASAQISAKAARKPAMRREIRSTCNQRTCNGAMPRLARDVTSGSRLKCTGNQSTYLVENGLRSCVTLLTSIAHRRVEKMPSHRHRKEVHRASGYRKNESVESEAPINSRVLSWVSRVSVSSVSRIGSLHCMIVISQEHGEFESHPSRERCLVNEDC